jgi:hypothetical protein
MSGTPAYALSQLSNQFLLLRAPGFQARYAHAWLVWEASALPPVSAVEQETAMTRLPRARFPERPQNGDALCFALKGQEGVELSVGRSAENALVIPESSVSRHHATLALKNGVWHLSRAEDSMPMSLDRAPVSFGAQYRLGEKHEVVLGNVMLTFHTSASLVERIAGPPPAEAKSANR